MRVGSAALAAAVVIVVMLLNELRSQTHQRLGDVEDDGVGSRTVDPALLSPSLCESQTR